MAIIPYQEVARVQATRSSLALAEPIAAKWFQAALCGIREKELAIAHMDRSPDKDQPAAQLMRAALAHQQSLLDVQRDIWKKVHPHTADQGVDDPFLEPTIGVAYNST